MEYVACYTGCGDPWFTVGLLGAGVVGSFLAVRRRAWRFAGALAGLPLAAWALDGLLLGLLFVAALLVGGLAGRVLSEIMLRRIRAVFVTALVWACLWLPVGVIAGIYRSFRLQVYDGVPV